MRSGRSKPDTLKIAEGTFRKSRAKKNPPKAAGKPRCPFKARTIAKKKWDEVTKGLGRLGLIDEIDATHIEGLCKAYQTAKEADAIVDKDGMVIVGAKGTPIKHPAIQVSADAWHKVRMYCNDLGLNHLSRQRMESTIPDAGSGGIEDKYLG
jgi:P27 family predicted phage terminase small subunit